MQKKGFIDNLLFDVKNIFPEFVDQINKFEQTILTDNYMNFMKNMNLKHTAEMMNPTETMNESSMNEMNNSEIISGNMSENIIKKINRLGRLKKNYVSTLRPISGHHKFTLADVAGFCANRLSNEELNQFRGHNK